MMKTISAETIADSWMPLCRLQTAQSRTFITTFIGYLVRNERYLVFNNSGNYTNGGIIQILITAGEENAIWSTHRHLDLQEISPGVLMADRLADHSALRLTVHYIVIDEHPINYARRNDCQLLKLSTASIFDYSHMARAWPHEEELIKALYHPKRIQKWIDNGNAIEDYLN